MSDEELRLLTELLTIRAQRAQDGLLIEGDDDAEPEDAL